MLFIYDLFKKNGRARIFNYTGYLVEFVKTYKGANYTMRIYKLYRYINGVAEVIDTFPSYKLWKHIAYDIGMPGMGDKMRYIIFQSWYNNLVSKMQKTGMIENFPNINAPCIWINGIEYTKLPNDKEAPFMRYGGLFGPISEIVSNGVRSIVMENGTTIAVGEDEQEDEELDDDVDTIPF